MDISRLSEAQRQRYVEMRRLSAAELKSVAHRRLGPAKGLSCRVAVVDAPASETEATRDLMMQAAVVGATAIGNVACQRTGVILDRNCSDSFTCMGDALLVTDEHALSQLATVAAGGESAIGAPNQAARADGPSAGTVAIPERPPSPEPLGASPCVSGHWIHKVESGGRFVALENRTYWRVDPGDSPIAALWLPVSNVTICGDRMINVSEGHSVHVAEVGTSRSARYGGGGGLFMIEASVNDESFVINGSLFKAKTYCFGLDEGDSVLFLEGSASGACASAKILNLRRKETCEVWCE
jgi:hypothetical protein